MQIEIPMKIKMRALTMFKPIKFFPLTFLISFLGFAIFTFYSKIYNSKRKTKKDY